MFTIRSSSSALLRRASRVPRTATPTSLISRRFASSNSDDDLKQVNARYFGVSMDTFLAPTGPNVPSFFRRPGKFIKAYMKRAGLVCYNTMMVGIFRWQTGLKPDFNKWRNDAMIQFVAVNQAFAKKKLKPVSHMISIWVEEALENRLKHIPPHLKFEWKLVKFIKPPKLVSFQAVQMPGRPLETAQVIYRFDTQQQLTVTDTKSKQQKTQESTIVNYMAYAVDVAAVPNKVVLIGSCFESDVDVPIRAKPSDEMDLALRNMKEHGDIFRDPPKAIEQ